MPKKTPAFVTNPGPNQRRKTVPTSTRAKALADKLAKSTNNANTIATIVEYAPHLAPYVAPALAGGVMKGYKFIKKANEMFPEVGEAVKDKVDKVFSGKGAVNNVVAFPTSVYGLSKAPEPKPVWLNSGIVPACYTETYMRATDTLCDPLHLSCVSLQIPVDPFSDLGNYFIGNTAFDIQTRAQANVGFDIGVGTNFTGQQIRTAMNACISGLQHYYWFTSVMSYESDTRNKNEGMLNIRNSISAAQMNLITQLGRRLEDTPIPPRLVRYVKYMMANYYSGDNQGSTIIKICPNPTLITGGDAVAQTILTNVINNLSSAANSTVFSLMRRAIPQWRCGKLYDVTPIPNFDTNFKTIYSNLPWCVWDGTTTRTGPIVTTAAQTVSYNTYNNKLDGIAFASTSVYNSTTSLSTPGFVSAPNTLGISATILSTRLSWCNVGGVIAWRYSDFNNFNTISRQDSYQMPVSYAAQYTPHLYGSDKCQNVNANALMQTAENSLDYFFNVASISARSQLNTFNRKANGMI